MGVAEPCLRLPGAASPNAKSIQQDEFPLAVMAGRIKKFTENTSTIPEVMDFSKFSRFFLGGGPLSHFGCVLVSLG